MCENTITSACRIEDNMYTTHRRTLLLLLLGLLCLGITADGQACRGAEDPRCKREKHLLGSYLRTERRSESCLKNASCVVLFNMSNTHTHTRHHRFTHTCSCAYVHTGKQVRIYTLAHTHSHTASCCSLLDSTLNQDMLLGVMQSDFCWGYESGCTKENRLWVPTCEGTPVRPWASTVEEKEELFWKQADFGYVKEVVDTVQTICKPRKKGDSSLYCSKNLRYCTATNLYIDLRRFKEFASQGGRDHFLENIFRQGEVGGHCQLFAKVLASQGEHKSPLQSWFAELEQYTELDFKPTSKKHCDITVKKPTILMKLDAGVNLYHHYCDFYNLYASQHANGSFSDDVFLISWDTTTYPYHDLFSETWAAFSRYPLKMISEYADKRVCFRDVVFPLLPRMRGGLYYNTFIVPGCEGSGMMMAFHQHLMQRLNIPQDPIDGNRLRITLLQRTTAHRKILNEAELVKALKTVPWFDVQIVDYKFRQFSFLDQIKTTHNSDMFIGIHGAGLAHVMFLPDWAALFEIYNTEDARCYHDLARQRGVEYATWEDTSKLTPGSEGIHPQSGKPHAKFNNYSFDVEEFMRIIMRLADSVLLRKNAASQQSKKLEQRQSKSTHTHTEL